MKPYDLSELNDEQIRSVEKLALMGATQDKNTKNVFWCFQHCFLIEPDGEIIEL